jgi:hypothetical protein
MTRVVYTQFDIRINRMHYCPPGPQEAGESGRPEFPIDDDPSPLEGLAPDNLPHGQPLGIPGETHGLPDRHVVVGCLQDADRARRTVPILHGA